MVAGQEGIYSPVCLVPKGAAIPGHIAPAKPGHPGLGLSVGSVSPPLKVSGSLSGKGGVGLGDLQSFQLQPLRELGQILEIRWASWRMGV